MSCSEFLGCLFRIYWYLHNDKSISNVVAIWGSKAVTSRARLMGCAATGFTANLPFKRRVKHKVDQVLDSDVLHQDWVRAATFLGVLARVQLQLQLQLQLQ